MILKSGWKQAGLVSGLLGSACITASHAASPLFLANSAPPPGFEALNQPQQTVIDIYYGDRFIATQMVTYTSKWIKLSNPKAILDKISGITAPDVVLTALSGALDTHASKVCYQPNQKDCGLLSPTVAGGIFDEAKFRLNIFINPSYLKLTPATAKIFLPPSDANKSFIQQFSGSISGSNNEDGSQNDYTITGTSLFALKESNVQIDYDYSKTNHLSLNNVILEREFQGKQWQTGLLSTNGFGMAFSSDNPMWGFRLSSSRDTRLDRGLSEGTPLQIFMPVRGRVDIIKDGRLIYTTFEEAGNHLLNTSSFPAGSYDVTIRIRDNSGRIISEQTRFFARDLALPKKGAPSYFIEAGKIVENQSNTIVPKTTSSLIARAGINYRLADTWAVTGAFAGTQGHSFGEFSLFNMGKYYKVAPGFMVSPDGSHGVKLDSQLSWRDIVATFNYRRLWNTHNSSVTTTTTTVNGITTTSSNVDTFNLLQNSFEQADFSVSAPLFHGRAGYRSTYRRQTGFESTQIQALDYSRTLFENNKYSLTSRFTYSQSKNDKLIQLSFEFRWNTSSHFSHSVTALGQWQKQDNGTDGNTHSRDYNLRYQMAWNSGHTLNQDVDARLTAQKSKNQTFLQGSTTVGSEYGAFSGTVTQTYTKGAGNSTSYGANLSTSFAADSDGIALGGSKLKDSGLLVDIEGVPPSESFDVMVNGQRAGVAVGGKNSLIPLSPFSTYQVKLIPTGKGFYNFKESIRDVTLYPGNIVSLDYHIKSLRLIFGRLLNSQGQPVPNAKVTTINGFNNSTDENGIFQFEIPYDTTSLTFKEGNHQCSITLPKSRKQSPILRMGNTVCNSL